MWCEGQRVIFCRALRAVSDTQRLLYSYQMSLLLIPEAMRVLTFCPTALMFCSYLPNYFMIKKKMVYSESCRDTTEESLELPDTRAQIRDPTV